MLILFKHERLMRKLVDKLFEDVVDDVVKDEAFSAHYILTVHLISSHGLRTLYKRLCRSVGRVEKCENAHFRCCGCDFDCLSASSGGKSGLSAPAHPSAMILFPQVTWFKIDKVILTSLTVLFLEWIKLIWPLCPFLWPPNMLFDFLSLR